MIPDWLTMTRSYQELNHSPAVNSCECLDHCRVQPRYGKNSTTTLIRGSLQTHDNVDSSVKFVVVILIRMRTTMNGLLLKDLSLHWL